jgi:signal transduction histidine kinase
MLLLLTAAGAFVYWRVQFALDRRLNGDLQGAAASLAPLVTRSGRLPADSATLARVDGFQVLDPTGRVLDHGDQLRATDELGPRLLAEALHTPVFHDTGELLPIARRPLRLYATRVRVATASRRLVLVVAARRDQRDEALRELLLQLTAAGLGTLVLTSVVGDVLARAALRPVERYRRRAGDIAAGATDLRLEIPAGRDDEITRLGHTLNGMLDALSGALERERRFINDASHELRTPLTLLTSRVQLMLRRPRTAEQYEDALAEIEDDLDRMTRLADELLELGTRQQAGGAEAPHDLAAAALGAVDARATLAPPGSTYGAAGALQARAVGPVVVPLGAGALRRLIDNLLDNAALHGAPPVSVAVGRVDRWARLTVADDGPGMPPELLSVATERFRRAPEARSRPGSGLGLSLVTAIANDVGGQVRLCHAGRHHLVGAEVQLPCTHDARMTVTVLLPLSTHPGTDPRE